MHIYTCNFLFHGIWAFDIRAVSSSDHEKELEANDCDPELNPWWFQRIDPGHCPVLSALGDNLPCPTFPRAPRISSAGSQWVVLCSLRVCDSVPWPDLVSWSFLIVLRHAPAAKLHVWLALHNRCWLYDRLQRQGVEHQSVCPLCTQELGKRSTTQEHLVWCSQFSRRITTSPWFQAAMTSSETGGNCSLARFFPPWPDTSSIMWSSCVCTAYGSSATAEF